MNSDPKNTFRNPVQIGLLVDDLEKVLKNLEEIFGIGPFRIVDYPPPDLENLPRQYKGKDEKFSAKFCFFDLGNIELEIIQPISGKTIWRDFIDKHGPGLHHIKFNVPEHDPSRGYLKSKGIKEEQLGGGIGKNAGKVWINYDTEDAIGFSIEIMNEIVNKGD